MIEFLLGFGVGCLAVSLTYYLFPKEKPLLKPPFLIAVALLCFAAALLLYLAEA